MKPFEILDFNLFFDINFVSNILPLNQMRNPLKISIIPTDSVIHLEEKTFFAFEFHG